METVKEEKGRNTKYDYPEGMTSKEKKRFRVQMRAQNKTEGQPDKVEKKPRKERVSNGKSTKKGNKKKINAAKPFINNHKAVLKTYLRNKTNLDTAGKAKIFKLYDEDISYINFPSVQYLKMSIFLPALKAGKFKAEAA